jgi:hypothetical protein
MIAFAIYPLVLFKKMAITIKRSVCKFALRIELFERPNRPYKQADPQIQNSQKKRFFAEKSFF